MIKNQTDAETIKKLCRKWWKLEDQNNFNRDGIKQRLCEVMVLVVDEMVNSDMNEMLHKICRILEN